MLTEGRCLIFQGSAGQRRQTEIGKSVAVETPSSAGAATVSAMEEDVGEEVWSNGNTAHACA